MGPHLYQGACHQSCTLAACGWQLGEAPGVGGWGSPVASWSPCFGMKRDGGTPKGQALTIQGALQDEVLRGLRVRAALLSLPKVRGLMGARRECPSILPNPSITCRAQGAHWLCCQSSLPRASSGSFQLQGEKGMGGVKEGAPARCGCTPSALHVPHSPDELRLWLLAGLVLPEALPRCWLHPREMVVRGNRAEGGRRPPQVPGREGW